MTESHTFSGLTQSHGIGWISSETLDHTIINFFSLDRPSSQILNTYAYLSNARIAECNINCAPSFPPLVAVQEETFPDNPEGFRRLVKLVFEGGHASFFFSEVCFQTVSRKTVILMGKNS
jgi:hypothetical protein